MPVAVEPGISLLLNTDEQSEFKASQGSVAKGKLFGYISSWCTVHTSFNVPVSPTVLTQQWLSGEQELISLHYLVQP